ncbi:MAG: hypothetical protein ABR583_15130 [Gaiellaceae bacterium]
MKRMITLALFALFAMPAVALADPGTAADRVNAAEACRAQREAMGPAAFKATYGTNHNGQNAFGRCVSRQAHAQRAARHEAAQQCNAERKDAEFAVTHGGKTFEQYYGGGRKGAMASCIAQKAQALSTQGSEHTVNAAKACSAERAALGARDFGLLHGTAPKRANAFGRCVSQHERANRADEQNAAEQCRAEQSDLTFPASHGGKTFADFYGTNADDSNAFGKCVSTKAKAAADERKAARIKAAKICKAERAADPVAFRNRYGTGPKKSNAFGRCVSQHAKG